MFARGDTTEYKEIKIETNSTRELNKLSSQPLKSQYLKHKQFKSNKKKEVEYLFQKKANGLLPFIHRHYPVKCVN